MVTSLRMEQIPLFKATVERLLSTPVDDLPRIAWFLASSFTNCSSILNGISPKTTETSVSIHKLRTRISSLLQHRSPAGRLTAAVLIKTIAEVGGSGESTIWEPWARGLISCLNKSEAWEIRRVYLAAAVRIFLLTKDSPTLQREVTSPLLPPFLTASLAAIKPSQAKTSVNARATPSRLLSSVLHAWGELVQVQPSTFRPFLSRIQPICLRVLSDFGSSSELQDLAARLLSSTHLCSPKTTISGDWESTVSNLIQSAHSSLNLILRGYREQWYPNEASFSQKAFNHDYSKEPELINSDDASLDPWKGIFEGGERVSRLLHWLRKMLSCKSMIVSVPLGHLIDLTSRISSLSILAEPIDARKTRQTLAEVGREERDAVQAVVPVLQSSCLALILQVVNSLESTTTSILMVFIDQLFQVFESSKSIVSVRHQFYSTLAELLRPNKGFGLHLSPKRLEELCVVCGQDIESGLLQPEDTLSSKAPRHISATTSTEAFKQGQQIRIHQNEAIARCALQLWPLLLESLHPSSLSNSARAKYDRVAILIGDERSICASIMNPSMRRSGKGAAPSILPFFAQAADEQSMVLEAIKRPRMPLTYLLAKPSILQRSRSRSPSPKIGELRVARSPSSVPEHKLLPQGPLSKQMPEISTARLDTAALDIPNHNETTDESSGKRDFAAIRDDGNESQSALQFDEDVQHLKKARLSYYAPVLETPILETSILAGLPQSQLQENATEPKDLSNVSFRSLVAIPQLPESPNRTEDAMGSVEEGSDSDIPSINPALATDNEIDNEDEDGEEEEEAEEDEDEINNDDEGV
jgi:pre-rRNA-processing protein RIX1